ncbi:unnamed protein product [Amoebophrya sp. A25]|nr:unnamed protein product [Amoebophrya sp. A25]|eukprot:GSA25T00002284001.1
MSIFLATGLQSVGHVQQASVFGHHASRSMAFSVSSPLFFQQAATSTSTSKTLVQRNHHLYRKSSISLFSTNTTNKMPSSFPYVIVGGGNSAGYAVKTLMESGVAGSEICMIGSEPVAPYERPALTKGYLHAPGSKVRARLPGFHTCVGGGGERQTPEWYAEKGVTLRLGSPATKLDAGSKTVTCSDDTIAADKALYVATGCNARTFDMYQGTNVFTIRSEADCAGLVKAMEGLQGGKLVIIGGGYIGLEVAAGAMGWSENLSSLTILNMDNIIMKRVFSDATGFAEMLQASVTAPAATPRAIVENNVQFKSLTRDETGRVTEVVTEEGAFPCDIVVLGLGTVPATEFMPPELLEKGFVKVDGTFKFADGCYAFGDCALFPLDGAPTVLEHVANCRASAKHAVLSSLGKESGNYSLLPFFYSRMFEYTDKPLIWNMWGNKTPGATPHVTKAENGISAVWVDGGKVVCACVMMQNPPPTQKQLDAAKSLIGQEYTPKL